MKKTTTILILLALALFGLTMQAGAVIYMDEDFEGSGKFVDQNFPIQSDAADQTQDVATVQGLNVRTYDDAHITPLTTLAKDEGAVVDTRHFQGSKCYKLVAGQSLAPTAYEFNSPHNNWYRTWQFALSTDGASAAKPAGTVIGHFKLDQTTSGTTDPADTTFQIDLKTKTGGGVDLVLKTTAQGTTTEQGSIGSLTGRKGNWALVTIVQFQHRDDADPTAEGSIERWRAYDPASDTIKGPDGDAGADPANSSDELYYDMPFGMNFFVNTQAAPTVTVGNDVLGENWGTTPDVKNGPYEVGWEFVAENGTIYIDDIQWDCADHQNKGNGTPHEASERLDEFDMATTEPDGPDGEGGGDIPASAGPAWMLY